MEDIAVDDTNVPNVGKSLNKTIQDGPIPQRSQVVPGAERVQAYAQ